MRIAASIRDDWDRRARRRFRIQQDVRYERLRGLRVLDAGTGKTLDMSSNALRFTTAIPLRPGDKVKVAMNWPVLLDATCHLKMVIHGWVLRSNTSTATVTIGHYELRTRATDSPIFLSRNTGPANDAQL